MEIGSIERVRQTRINREMPSPFNADKNLAWDTMSSMKPADFPDHKKIVRIASDFCRIKPKNDHFHAVQLVCSSALELYRGIVQLCLDENPIPAKALSRVLLETLVTAVILAKHSEKLRDFRECGRYLHLRSLILADSDILPELESHRQNLIAKHGADYDTLHRKFGKKPWHGMTRRDSLKEAGFDFNTYDTFYRPTSEFTHADPSRYIFRHELTDEWIFGRSNKKEAIYNVGAYVSSTDLLLVGMEQINRALDLAFDERLKAFKEMLFEFVPKYRESVLAASRKGSRQKN